MTGAGALNRTAELVPPDLFPISKDLGWLRMAKYDLAAFPNVAAWLARCLSRPANLAARATK